jgi:hypothetical protein
MSWFHQAIQGPKGVMHWRREERGRREEMQREREREERCRVREREREDGSHQAIQGLKGVMESNFEPLLTFANSSKCNSNSSNSSNLI